MGVGKKKLEWNPTYNNDKGEKEISKVSNNSKPRLTGSNLV